MRAITTILIGLISISVHAQAIDPHKQLTIKTLAKDELKVQGTVMVEMAMVGGYGFTWDGDYTTYLTTVNRWGGSTKLRISEVGAASATRIVHQGWPYLRNRKGRLYAMDDSLVRSSMAKFERYLTFSKVFSSAWKGIAGGTALTAAMLIDQNTAQAIFAPDTGLSFPFFGGWILAYLGEAGLDQFKSHRTLGHGGNFFTKEIARNVVDVLPVREIKAAEDAPIVDYEIHIRKGKNGLLEKVYLSELISSGNPKAPKYRSESCEAFMRQ